MNMNNSLIKETVEHNPGIGFTELKSVTRLQNGVLQYHINNSPEIIAIKKAILLKDQCDTCTLSDICRERCVLNIMRNPLKKNILRMIKDGKKQKDISETLKLHKSTVSYHVKSLRESGLI